MLVVLGMLGTFVSPGPMRVRAAGAPPAQVAGRRIASARTPRGSREDDACSADVWTRVEPRVRRVVAEHLGVSARALGPTVSLGDGLAADSLDILELVVALESEFGIAVPERSIALLRTYGDVVAQVVSSSLAPGEQALAGRSDLVVRSRLRAGGTDGLVRASALTPYVLQTIEDDALSAGRGARLEVDLSSTAARVDDAVVAHVRDRLAWLERRGVLVSVRRA
jgi:acyl carrier protein